MTDCHWLSLKNSFAIAWHCPGIWQTRSPTVDGVRLADGRGPFVVTRQRQVTRKMHSGAGVPLLVTGFAWTIRGHA